MSYVVQISRKALQDLEAIHNWLSEAAGEDLADQYHRRIEERLRTLAEFPDRGTPREDLKQGVRSVLFERRLVILYRVEQRSVLILRIIHGAREMRATEL